MPQTFTPATHTHPVPLLQYELPTDIKQLRQSTYKAEHVQRRQQGSAASVLTDLRKSRPRLGKLPPGVVLPPIPPGGVSAVQSPNLTAAPGGIFGGGSSLPLPASLTSPRVGGGVQQPLSQGTGNGSDISDSELGDD